MSRVAKRDEIRAAFERARGAERPDAGRLVDAVPALMAEARRRAEPAPDFTAVLAARSRWAVPRLAAVTLVAVAAASLLLYFGNEPAAATPKTFEGAVLGNDDQFLEAVLSAGRTDG